MSKLDLNTAVTTLDGRGTTLQEFEGKVLLIVNTASECGYTPQFDGLEKLWQDYGDRGLVVLGFPCNQFGKQEPGGNEEIGQFCRLNYGVTFPMFAKIDVNGKDALPLFRQLKKAAPGLLGLKRIAWNFTKFLVGRDATVLARFATKTEPADLREAIEEALKA